MQSARISGALHKEEFYYKFIGLLLICNYNIRLNNYICVTNSLQNYYKVVLCRFIRLSCQNSTVANCPFLSKIIFFNKTDELQFLFVQIFDFHAQRLIAGAFFGISS